MIRKIYSIYDEPTCDHAVPFVADNDKAAERLVKGALTPQSQLVMYPSDYSLVCLGNFDTETGVITPDHSDVAYLKNLIPPFLRSSALDGTFERGVESETKEDSSAQG